MDLQFLRHFSSTYMVVEHLQSSLSIFFCPTMMPESTLYDQPLLHYKTTETFMKGGHKVNKDDDVNEVKQPELGERAQEQVKKYEAAVKFQKTIAWLKAQGLTKIEMADMLPEYEYTEDFGDVPGYKRTKSMVDLRAGTGTCSPNEWCGF